MTFQLWRQDDHGNEFLIATFTEREKADAECARYAALPHHQHYWVASCQDRPVDADPEA